MNSSLLPLRSGVCCQGGGEERGKAKKRREPQNLSGGRGSLHSGSAQVNSETRLIEGEEGAMEREEIKIEGKGFER